MLNLVVGLGVGAFAQGDLRGGALIPRRPAPLLAGAGYQAGLVLRF